MIVGHGDIAKAIPKLTNDKRIYFASGVSNSQETRESEYLREINLLLSQDKSKHLVYFSSLCIFYSSSRYAQHKLYMEHLVKKNFDRYTIMRLGNIDWGNNPNTIINHFRNRKKAGKTLHIKPGFRYIINMDEFQHWIKLIPEWSCEMNVTGKRMTIKQIAEELA